MAKVARLDKLALFRKLGYEPHPGQREIHLSRAKRRVVACGVRWGKTWCAAMEGLAAAMAPAEHSVGWVVAPTYDLAERVFLKLSVTAASQLRHRIVKLSEHDRHLVMRNMGGGLSEIRAKSADNPVSLLGEGLDWLVCDESARLKASIWESYLSQRLLDKKGWALLISTPRGKGWFYDAWRRGQGNDPGYQSWNSPSSASPLLPRDDIEKERERLPERVFAQEYLGMFLSGDGQVFRNVRELATGEWRDPEPGRRYAAGLDLGQTMDFTVLTIVNEEREVVFFDRYHRLDWNFQTNRIRAALDRYNHARVLVDSTGVGEPIFEELRRGGCHAEGYKFTQGSKADLINHLSIKLEQGKVTLPRPELCPDLIDELEAFEYSVTDSGNARTGAPSGMHDDAVISLALALWRMRDWKPKPRIDYAMTMRDLQYLHNRINLGGRRQ